ncbi:hypothetical protein [Consotaella aegiceratis]|uniref:hypothetical protein n=1 Tax=Consotaella aegiceratis TaxID=3097961 RepID=UPI002F420E99
MGDQAPRLSVDSPEQLQRVLDTVLVRVSYLEAEFEAGRVRISELEAIVVLKDARIVELEDEVARLKGLPPRPKFKGKPSGMEQATSKPIGKKVRKPGARWQSRQADRHRRGYPEAQACPREVASGATKICRSKI